MRSDADDLLVQHVMADEIDMARDRATYRDLYLHTLRLLHAEKRANAELRRRSYEETRSRRERVSERPQANTNHGSHSTAANSAHVRDLKHPNTGTFPAAVRA